MLERIEYTIDPTGRRIGRRVEGGDEERYLYGDALNPIARLDASNRIEQVYVYGTHAHVPDVIIQYNPATGAEVERYAVLRDLRGSVLRVVSVDDGEVAQALEYGPWGEVLVDTNPGWQPFGFAGGEYDHVTGLVRFGARDYDATIGRWLAADPIGFAGGDTNLYAYVGGDPVGLVDVNGENPAAAAVVAGVGYAGVCALYYMKSTSGSLNAAATYSERLAELYRERTELLSGGDLSDECWDELDAINAEIAEQLAEQARSVRPGFFGAFMTTLCLGY